MAYPKQTIEQLLLKFKPVLGKDYEKYRNHVYRVFLNCLLIDDDKINEDKYAIAAVFHDIGIWTGHTFDYLPPSIEQAKLYLEETGKQDWADEISNMIFWHHKMSASSGESETTIETFRKADWTDVSLGLLTYGTDKQKIRENRMVFPNAGFHVFLVKQAFNNLLKHPFNPLPMFKK